MKDWNQWTPSLEIVFSRSLGDDNIQICIYKQSDEEARADSEAHYVDFCWGAVPS